MAKNYILNIVRQLILIISLHKLSGVHPYLKLIIVLPLLLNLLINEKQINSTRDEDVIIKVGDLGLVRGSLEKTLHTNREFLSFTGVPYGEIPLRFSTAVLKTTLDNEFFDATLPQQACIQPPLLPFLPGNFTEDCLTLNIHTPTKDVWKDGKLLPVLVFIHGGSFFRWSGNMFNGQRFLERDVVLVSINYRLNVFGFFSLENDDVPGNMGLYDQILALQFIQKYIRYYGGNPKQITIAGQSAGGAAVTYLLDSPMAKGLFHGVITSSGDSFAGWAIEHNPLKNSLSAANALGCANGTLPNQDLKIVFKCMQSIPSHQILDALPVFFSAPSLQNFELTKVPKIIPSRKPNQPKHNNEVPLMVGINRNDGSFLLSRIYTNFLESKNRHDDSHYLKTHFIHDLLTSSHFGFIDSPNGTIDALIKTFVDDDDRNSGEFERIAPGLTEIYSKYYFANSAHKTVSLHSQGGSDAYFYSFDYEGQLSLYPHTGGVSKVPRGVAHGDDLMYLFNFGEFSTQEEQRVSSLLVDYWVNFATTGNPNKRSIEEPSPEQLWPKFCNKLKSIMRIKHNLSIESFKEN